MRSHEPCVRGTGTRSCTWLTLHGSHPWLCGRRCSYWVSILLLCSRSLCAEDPTRCQKGTGSITCTAQQDHTHDTPERSPSGTSPASIFGASNMLTINLACAPPWESLFTLETGTPVALHNTHSLCQHEEASIRPQRRKLCRSVSESMCIHASIAVARALVRRDGMPWHNADEALHRSAAASSTGETIPIPPSCPTGCAACAAFQAARPDSAAT